MNDGAGGKVLSGTTLGIFGVLLQQTLVEIALGIGIRTDPVFRIDQLNQAMNKVMADPEVRRQLDQSVFDEIVPTVHMPQKKAEAFARAVFERFENPFVKHALLSVSLNSISKWKARVLPTLKDSIALHQGRLPKWLTYSFAALLAFYRTKTEGEGCLIGIRGTNEYEIHDDEDKLEFIRQTSMLPRAEYAKAVMKRTDWWGEDLTRIPGFLSAVTKQLDSIAKHGARQHIARLAEEA